MAYDCFSCGSLDKNKRVEASNGLSFRYVDVETDTLADGLLKTGPKNHNLAQWDVVIG